MGRSRWFPAPIHTEIRKQPHSEPYCLALGSKSQSQPLAPTPHFLQSTTPLSHPNPSSSPSYPCHNLCPCHRLPPTPPLPVMVSRRPHQSEDSDESLPHIHKSLNTKPFFLIYFFIFFSFPLLLVFNHSLNLMIAIWYPVPLYLKKNIKKMDQIDLEICGDMVTPWLQVCTTGNVST